MTTTRKTEMENSTLKRLGELFEEIYDFIYDNNDKVPGYRWAVELFDDEIKRNKDWRDIVDDFTAYRGGAITSDREAAAFMFAFIDLCER